jgi:hypothetical protein
MLTYELQKTFNLIKGTKMNTQNTQALPEVTFYQTVGDEQFTKTISQFKNKARHIGLTAQEHILYNIIRNLPTNRGFSLATNAIKLANGYAPDSKFKFAKSNLFFVIQYNFKVFAEAYGWNEEVKAFFIEALNKKN